MLLEFRTVKIYQPKVRDVTNYLTRNEEHLYSRTFEH